MKALKDGLEDCSFSIVVRATGDTPPRVQTTVVECDPRLGFTETGASLSDKCPGGSDPSSCWSHAFPPDLSIRDDSGVCSLARGNSKNNRKPHLGRDGTRWPSHQAFKSHRECLPNAPPGTRCLPDTATRGAGEGRLDPCVKSLSCSDESLKNGRLLRSWPLSP